MIVNLGSNNFENNNNFTFQLNNIQIFLLMRAIDTPEKYVSNDDRKIDTRKIHTFSVNSSSTLFFCSICAMHN